MNSRWAAGAAMALCLLCLMVGCGNGTRTPPIALVGATLIDGTGRDPLPNAVIVVEKARFRDVGGGPGTSIPFGAVRVDLRGKYVIPELVNAIGSDRVDAHYTAKDIERDLAMGMKVLYGVPADDSHVPLNMLELIQSSNVAVAPMLSGLSDPAALGFAQANVKTMIESGVMVAVASTERTRAGMVREMQLMAARGVDRRDILLAATRNGAKTLNAPDGSGTIQDGAPADLLVLPGSPLADLEMINKAERAMHGGVWKEGSR